MTEGIITALITGGLALAGVVITTLYGNKQTKKTVKAQTDLTIYRIEQLEQKQDKHNSLIERMYKVEEDIAVLQEQHKVEKNRIKDLEKFHAPH